VTTAGADTHAGVARADTPADTIYGEGGDAMTPVMIKLFKDDAAQLTPEFGSYTNVDLDQSIADFIGSAPNIFGANFAVTERKLTTTEAATAKTNGRTYTYVPIAAVPVALMTLVPQPTFPGNGTINPAQYCQHIPLNLTQLAAIYGAPTPTSWGDPSLACSTGGPAPDAAPFTLWANLDPTMENFSMMNLLDSTTSSMTTFQAGLTQGVTTHKALTADSTPSEFWPYTGSSIPGGDEALLGKMIGLDSKTNLPSTQTAQVSIGGIVPISSVWTGDPLGPHWNLPTAAVQNAQGTYVAPTTAAAAAAETDAMLSATTDPTTNNLVTFTANGADAAAYNSYLMMESYLLVPTNGLDSTKALSLAQFIRFALGTTGQKDIAAFGAAPATSAMVAAGLVVAQALDAEAATSTTTTTTASTTTTTTAPTGTTTTTVATAGSGNQSASGGSSTGDPGTGTTGNAGSGSGVLAFTGMSTYPLLGLGFLLLATGETSRRLVRRRSTKT
jgi:hypothetical protein